MLRAAARTINPKLRISTGRAGASRPWQAAASLGNDISTLIGTVSARLMRCEPSTEAVWEEMIRRTLAPDDLVVVMCNGHASLCWARMAQQLGLRTEIIESAWGSDVAAGALARRLGCDLGDTVRAVFVMETEPSTGVSSDLAAVRRAMDESFHDALLLVEATASIGATPFRMDEWGVDVVRFDLAGAALVGLSERASEAFCGKQDVSHLLPILEEMFDMGVSTGATCNVPFEAARRVASGLRHGLAAMELGLVARNPRFASDSITVVALPQTICARDVIQLARQRFGVELHDGLGELAGQVIRIVHDGGMDENQCLWLLWVIERVLDELGAGIVPGVGVEAAMCHFGIAQNRFQTALHIAAE